MSGCQAVSSISGGGNLFKLSRVTAQQSSLFASHRLTVTKV